jgi:hypothetical protein
MNLPRPVAAYLAAEQARDPDAQALCFTDDAIVRDEDREYRGHDAIRTWKRDALQKYGYDLEPLDASLSGDRVRVRVRMTGRFPGSPVELDYTFTLRDDLIASLEI